MARFLLEARRGAAPAILVFDDATGTVSVDRTATETTLSWGSPACDARSTIVVRPDTGEARVTIDRFGLHPAVMRTEADRTLIASDLSTLMDARPHRCRRLDKNGLISLLAFGQCLGSDTPWRGTRHLPAGAALSVHLGSEPALEQNPIVLPNKASRPRQALDALVAAIGAQLEAAPDTMIPLSGGLDSRLLLACAKAAGHRPDTLCYGDPDSADRRIAESLAAAAGSAHVGRAITTDVIRRATAEIARAGGGEVPVHHGHGVVGARAMADLHGRPVMTGTGSETFRAFYYDRGLPGMSALGSPAAGALRGKAVAWALEHFGAAKLAALPHALADPVRAQLRQAVIGHVDAAPDLARGLDAAYLGVRVRRFVVAGQQLLNRYHPRLHPFLHPDVVTTLSGLPVGWKLGARFHRWAIQQLAPELAGVTWDRTNRPLSSGLTWQERWPGLAARLGHRGRFAKAGTPLADYGPWAAEIDAAALAGRVLDLSDATASERAALRSWTAQLSPLHVIGTLAALEDAAPVQMKGVA